tara:strand:- start:160 stop:657 length:498 start_codon:yes stop_codon:yes gene_type:complete
MRERACRNPGAPALFLPWLTSVLQWRRKASNTLGQRCHSLSKADDVAPGQPLTNCTRLQAVRVDFFLFFGFSSERGRDAVAQSNSFRALSIAWRPFLYHNDSKPHESARRRAMNDPQLYEAPASWWTRLTQAMLREPAVTLLEKNVDDRAGDADALPTGACEGAR